MANLINTKKCEKSWKITETLANGYSSESTQRELSNEYQHDRVWMVFKDFCILVLWTKVVSALKGLISEYWSSVYEQGRMPSWKPIIVIQGSSLAESSLPYPQWLIEWILKLSYRENTNKTRLQQYWFSFSRFLLYTSIAGFNIGYWLIQWAWSILHL